MGNFIPKPYSTEQVSIRVDTELLARVEAAANKYNMSRNAFINECIRYAMANMADPPEADRFPYEEKMKKEIRALRHP